MAGRRISLAVLALVAVAALASTSPAAAAGTLAANPWTGQWVEGATVNRLSQTGTQIAGSANCPGAASNTIGVTLTGTASADNTTVTLTYSGCASGFGGTFTGTMSADGQSATGSGSTVNGTGFTFKWQYQGGGTEPRVVLPMLPFRQPQCRTAATPWEGTWAAKPGFGGWQFQQTGAQVLGSDLGAERTNLFTGTVSGDRLTGKVIDGRSGVETPATFTLASLTVITGTVARDSNDPNSPTESFRGEIDTSSALPSGQQCTPLAGATTGPAPNLANSIPNPRTVSVGPATVVAPGKISVRSLKRSKCVRTLVLSTKPARVNVRIFSGRRSIRLFGEKTVRFRRPGKQVACIPVPFRAHTFNPRTRLRLAVGVVLGAVEGRGGPRPRTGPSVVRPIDLVA
jgi:hypothetical protein